MARVMVGTLFLALFLAIGCVANARSGGTSESLVKNPGFEDSGVGVPGWWIDPANAPKGSATITDKLIHSGKSALRLEPTALNTDPDKQLGVGQLVPAAGLRGKKLYLSAWLAADKGAKAIFATLVVGKDGKPKRAEALTREDADNGLAHFEGTLDVPDEPDIEQLIVVCAVAGTAGWAEFDDLIVSTSIPESFSKRYYDPGPPIQASVNIHADKVIRRIPKTLYGFNTEWIWEGKGLWDPTQKAFRPEVVSLTKGLGASLLRFPGGTFSDFYHWNKAVGPQDERPSTPSELTGDSYRHSVGTPEILDFANRVGAELIFTANAGSGTPEEAASWVAYTRKNGRQAVKYWEIGNEVYLSDESQGTKTVTMTPEKYARTADAFADAIRKADPTVKIGAILDESYFNIRAYKNWTATVLNKVAPKIDFVAVHNAYAPVLMNEGSYSLRDVYSATLATPLLIKRNLDEIAAKLHALSPADAKRIKIAVTEWGTLYHSLPSAPFVDHCKTLGSALYTASVMKAFLETPEVEIANYFALIDPLFIGVLGPKNGQYVPTASYYAMQLYTRHFGDTLVASDTTSPTYASRPVGLVPMVSKAPYVECVASTSSNGKNLHIVLINKHFDRAANVTLNLNGFRAVDDMDCWTLGGTGLDANTGTKPFAYPGVQWAKQASDEYDPRFESGSSSEVWLRKTILSTFGASSTVNVPAHSVVCLVLKGQ